MKHEDLQDWLVHPVTREIRKRLEEEARDLAESVLREIAQDTSASHRAAWWDGYKTGINAWTEVEEWTKQP